MNKACNKGYSCGKTCINRERNCSKKLTGQSIELASSLVSLITSVNQMGETIGEGAYGIVKLSRDGNSVYKIDKKDHYDLFQEAEYTEKAGELGVGAKLLSKGVLANGQKYIELEYLKDFYPLEHADWEDEIEDNLRAALGKLYDAGIYHEDIHGSNVLVNRNNEVRIIDFGMIRDGRPPLGKAGYIDWQIGIFD